MLWCLWTPLHAAESLAGDLDEARARWIGERIFANECNLNVRCLTSWNAGEDFPSLGIGHFIWYREGQQERFRESFPELLRYYESRGVMLPDWLRTMTPRDQPWPDREAFLADLDGPQLSGLRTFLDETRDVQARFIIRRLQRALPSISAHSEEPAAVESLFRRVAAARPPLGLYALIDYVNFKGEGVAAGERYRGQGWGLLQVLEYMHDNPSPSPVLQRFSEAAAAVLARRVENAPPERGESRWLAGWNNRVETYWPEGD
ncbi:MAG: hypothetical protein WEB57_06855 [Pseudohongiellaceae bacterium]